MKATITAWEDFNYYIHQHHSRYDELIKYGHRFIYLGADFDDILEIGWLVTLWTSDLHTTTKAWKITPETY